MPGRGAPCEGCGRRLLPKEKCPNKDCAKGNPHRNQDDEEDKSDPSPTPINPTPDSKYDMISQKLDKLDTLSKAVRKTDARLAKLEKGAKTASQKGKPGPKP